MTSLPQKLSDWPLEAKELWSERASIMEFVANMTRESAEYWAEKDIRKQFASDLRRELGVKNSEL